MSEPRFPWLPVARWEASRILTRVDFIISVLLTPALLFGVSLFMTMGATRAAHPVAVVRVDPEGRVVARGAEAVRPLAGFEWLDPGEAGADTVALAEAVRAKRFEMAAVLREGAGSGWSADLIARREPPRWTRDVRLHLQQESRRVRLREWGLDSAQVATLDDTLAVRVRAALGGAAVNRRIALFTTLGIMMLTIVTVLTSISYMMVGISGEKQARVTEVVVSAVPAGAWMDGKIVAYTLVGLVTGVVWAASLLVMAGPFAFQLPASIHAGTLALTFAFSLLGLFLYNALIAALMASAQNIQSASKWQSNFVMLPFLPIAFLGALLDNPDSLPMVILSHFPFFSPFMFPVRLVQSSVAWWEIALALTLLLAACAWMRRAAGRVFRLGMLMYGKDMTLPELVRWMRTP